MKIPELWENSPPLNTMIESNNPTPIKFNKKKFLEKFGKPSEEKKKELEIVATQLELMQLQIDDFKNKRKNKIIEITIIACLSSLTTMLGVWLNHYLSKESKENKIIKSATFLIPKTISKNDSITPNLQSTPQRTK